MTDTDRIKELEQRLSIYENENLEKQGFFALKRYVTQQIKMLSEFELETEIKKTVKDDKYYDRVKAIGGDLKEMIVGLKNLKSELKISKQDEEDDNTPFIETIAQSRK